MYGFESRVLLHDTRQIIHQSKRTFSTTDNARGYGPRSMSVRFIQGAPAFGQIKTRLVIIMINTTRLRLLIGWLGLLLPWIVSLLLFKIPQSIAITYYTI